MDAAAAWAVLVSRMLGCCGAISAQLCLGRWCFAVWLCSVGVRVQTAVCGKEWELLSDRVS